MTLVFAFEGRFEKGIDEKIYSIDGMDYRLLWDRYLELFNHVYVVARVKKTDKIFSSDMLAESERMSFVEVPYYIGLRQYFSKKKRITAIIKQIAIPGRAYICRVPGIIGHLLSTQLRKKNILYGVEVVGDPWDVFSPSSIRNYFNPILRIYSLFQLRKIVRNSSAVLYVTKEKLQKRYPPNSKSFHTFASNVILPDNKMSLHAKVFSKSKSEKINIISIGSLAQMYKSPDILIDAVKILNDKGWDCILTWLGDGMYLEPMIRYAKSKGIHEKIFFLGSVNPEIVRQKLKSSDLFILASRTEGLPRAMIEAMAFGLPCIGTKIGGIPELLPEEALVAKNNSIRLADKIEELLIDKEKLNSMAERNLKEASYYVESVLKKRRKEFYEQIIDIS